MSENNYNEADALFATRRKKQQDEEAMKAAQRAEEERLAELERQKVQVAEDIKRLEALQAIQKEQAELEAQRAAAEKEALERQREQSNFDAEKMRAENEAYLRQTALAEQEAKRQKAEAKALKQQAAGEKTGIQKFLPFIIGGAALVVVAVVVLIIVLSGGKKGGFANLANSSDWYRTTDSDTGVTFAYPSILEYMGDESEDYSKDYYYYDMDSDHLQSLDMRIFPDKLEPGDTVLLANEEFMNTSLKYAMESKGAVNYEVKKYKDSIWYAAGNPDEAQAGEAIPIAIIGFKGEEFYLEINAWYTKEADGTKRFITEDDILEVYLKMLDNLSVG